MYLQKFSMTMYIQKVFSKRICTKICYMYKISKDNVSTNFEKRVYFQKYIYFFFKKNGQCVYVSCNHYIADFFSLFFVKKEMTDFFLVI